MEETEANHEEETPHHAIFISDLRTSGHQKHARSQNEERQKKKKKEECRLQKKNKEQRTRSEK